MTLIESTFGVRAGTATSTMTVDTSPAFAHRCVESAVWAADAATAYQVVFDVADWPNQLPHVQCIDVLYNDGQYQEFLMTVRSDTSGSPLTVRSVRNCRAGIIEFFQPEPPPFLAHHGGIWRFRQLPTGDTDVEVAHVWNLEPEVAADTFPASASCTTEAQVSAMLAGHSRLTLSSWQRVLWARREGLNRADH